MATKQIQVDLSQLLTPASRCVCLNLGRIDYSILKSLEENDFEVAPVVDENDLVIGMISTADARELASQDSEISVADLQVDNITLPETVDLKSLFDQLRDRTAIIIAPKLPSRTEPISWTGLVTIYDLNRHYFRTVLYGLLAELEVALATVIHAWRRDPWDWIAVLNEEEQARVIGYWQLALRRHADIGPTAACMITQLLKIIASDKPTLVALGIRSKAEFEKQTGGIPQLRNQIMHPVRAMVMTLQDVGILAGRIDRIRELNLRIENVKAHSATAAEA